MAYGGAALGRVNGFTLQKLLGKGTFGTVYQATRENDGRTYAIKKVDTRKMGAKDRAEAVNEIRVLASIAGSHIITFFEAFVEQDILYIVTEFAAHGDLFNYLKEARKRGPIKEATVWSLFIQMSLGLKSLHDRNILHRDLKGANIFMCSPTYIKLGDFGVSKVLKSDQALARTQVGTPYYVAPEVWRNRPYNAKCDMWSLGCLLYELCTFRPPFEAESMEGLARKIMRGKFEPIPSGYSRELQSLVGRLLVVEPARRASVEDVLSHPGVLERMSSLPSPASLGKNSPPFQDGPVDLVSTIIVPQRFKDLHKNLPPSRYDAPAPSPPEVDPSMGRVHAASGGSKPAPAEPAARSPDNPAAYEAHGRVPIGTRAPPGQSPHSLQRQYVSPVQQQGRHPESAVPNLPQIPGSRKPPVSASAAAARQLAQPAYRQQQGQERPERLPPVPGRVYSRPSSGASRPGSGASYIGPGGQIRVVYHNPQGYAPQASKGSIFRSNSNADVSSIYNPITHQQSPYQHQPGSAYHSRNQPQQPHYYQSRLARLHTPSQENLQQQPNGPYAQYAAHGRAPMQRRM